MKLSLAAATAVAAVVGSALAFGQNPATPAPAPATAPGSTELKDLKSKVSYIIGLNMGKSFKTNGVEIDPDLVVKGLKTGLAGDKPLLTDAEIGEILKTYQQQLQSQAMENAKKQADTNKRSGLAFLAANAKQPGVVTLPSGLQYKVVKEGAGVSPKATDVVTVDYEGRLIDGTVFDSSAKAGKPVSFPVNRVIPGWTQALQLMKVGSKWQLFIPADLAYGEGAPQGSSIQPNSTLIFDVELLKVGGGQ